MDYKRIKELQPLTQYDFEELLDNKLRLFDDYTRNNGEHIGFWDKCEEFILNGLSMGDLNADGSTEYLSISCPKAWSGQTLDLFLVIFIEVFVDHDRSVGSIGVQNSLLLNDNGLRLFLAIRGNERES